MSSETHVDFKFLQIHFFFNYCRPWKWSTN